MANFLLAFHGFLGHTGHSCIAMFSLLGKRCFCLTSLRRQTASQPMHELLQDLSRDLPPWNQAVSTRLQ